MGVGKHSEESPRAGVRLAVLGVLAAIVVGIGVGALTGVIGLDRVFAWVPGRSSPVSTASTPASATGDPAPAASATGPSTATATPTASATSSGAATSALTACVRKQAGAATVVTAAAKGDADWSEHVMGQTDIEDGSRSLTVVERDLWGPTRSAGPADVSAFLAAKQVYDALPGCVAVAAVATSPTSARLTRCVTRQGLLDTYLAAATAMMTDWQGHLQAMERHSAGLVGSAAAQEDWLRRWQAAPAHLAPYAAATAALTSAPVCAA